MGAQQIQAFPDALEALASGGLVVYPTETFYGLGSLLDDGPVKRLARLKGRQAGKPLPVITGSREMVAMVARQLPSLAERLANLFWPGPLTLVLPARPDLPAPVSAGTGTVGVRVTGHPVAAKLSQALGQPLIATSANPAGLPPATDLNTACSYFGDQVEAYLDGGELPGVGSTVVKVGDESVTVLRQGLVTISSLREALPGRFH